MILTVPSLTLNLGKLIVLIKSIILKDCASVPTPCLVYFFLLLPSYWENDNIQPAAAEGVCSNASNYCPTAAISCLTCRT